MCNFRSLVQFTRSLLLHIRSLLLHIRSLLTLWHGPGILAGAQRPQSALRPENIPIQMKKRPIYIQKRPIYIQKRALASLQAHTTFLNNGVEKECERVESERQGGGGGFIRIQ